MRLLALVSLLCLIAATVLTVLLIVAGDRPDFLENVNILTLNTSDVGSTLISSSSSPLASVTSNPAVASLIANNPTASQVASAVSSEANSIAQDIGIHDWYSLHLLDFCEGYYTPSSSAANATKNITSCSNSTSLWTFNLSTIIQNELHTGISLADIKWPDQVQEGLTVLETAMRVMFVFYCIAAGLSGLGVIAAIVGLLFDGRLTACLNAIWVTLDVVATAIASVIATVVMVKAVDEVNQYTDEIGIVAYKGNQFLAMTWAAVGVLLLAWVTWLVDCCVGGSRRKYRSTRKEPY